MRPVGRNITNIKASELLEFLFQGLENGNWQKIACHMYDTHVLFDQKIMFCF